MKFNKRMWVWFGVGVGLVVVVVIVMVFLGVYNVVVDDLYSCLVYVLFEMVCECFIEVCVVKFQVFMNLDDFECICQGVGNYNVMCVICYFLLEVVVIEMSKGLYFVLLNLSKQLVVLVEVFWVIKYGIKVSGMFVWGGSMDDEFIWNMLVFLQKLFMLDKVGYQVLVVSSDGYLYGGGEM